MPTAAATAETEYEIKLHIGPDHTYIYSCYVFPLPMNASDCPLTAFHKCPLGTLHASRQLFIPCFDSTELDLTLEVQNIFSTNTSEASSQTPLEYPNIRS